MGLMLEVMPVGDRVAVQHKDMAEGLNRAVQSDGLRAPELGRIIKSVERSQGQTQLIELPREMGSSREKALVITDKQQDLKILWKIYEMAMRVGYLTASHLLRN
jgi:hypothetical protein